MIKMIKYSFISFLLPRCPLAATLWIDCIKPSWHEDIREFWHCKEVTTSTLCSKQKETDTTINVSNYNITVTQVQKKLLILSKKLYIPMPSEHFTFLYNTFLWESYSNKWACLLKLDQFFVPFCWINVTFTRWNMPIY